MSSMYPWYEEWFERKNKYARTKRNFLFGRSFRIYRRRHRLTEHSAKVHIWVSQCSRRCRTLLGQSKSGERPFARIYTRLGNPTTEYLEKCFSGSIVNIL